MAKFTVFFKDAPIQSAMFDSGVIHIGRDNTNNIVIDSLAVAPTHAAVVINGDEVAIKQLDEEYPLFVNGIKTKQCALQSNDKIHIGKHMIVFSSTEANFLDEASPHDSDIGNVEHKAQIKDGNLQIVGGQHIGRLIPLKKAMTRLGSGSHGMVMITKRKDGYFIAALENHPSLKVNNKPLGESIVKLNDNDRLVIDNTPMQFFLD